MGAVWQRSVTGEKGYSRPVLRTYDLLVQSREPGEPFPREAAVAALTAAGARFDEHGRGAWRLPAGELELGPMLENGAWLALEVKVPLSDKTELLEAAVRALCDVAEQAPLRVIDPQRGEPVSVTGLGSMASEFFRLARHAGEYGGVSEALGLSSYASEAPRDSGSTRALLALVVFVLALYATWRTATALLDDEAEAPVDAPAKVLGK